jgi:protein-S-isoprenylcysteine O-methyltransferase Ste14
MLLYNALISIFWLVFIVFWIVSAFSSKRTIRRNWSFLWFRLVFIVIILLFFRSELSQGFGGGYQNFILTNPWEGLLGVVLCGMGIALAIWARVYLGRNWGMPMSLKEHPELVTTGPYAYIRHPIYSGVLLAMLGSVLGSGLWWIAILVVSGVYFIYSATREEKIMTKEFPNDYPAYQKRTKMLIPFLF